MSLQKFASALAVLACVAQAAIVDDGLWTGKDWYDSASHIGVKNGVPYSKDVKVNRRITSPMTFDGPVDATYLSSANVKRVQKFFKQNDWDKTFPQANKIYTYDNFLKAVAKFPAFCNEKNTNNMTQDEVCKRELASLFAHWGQETGKRDPNDGEFWKQGLYWVEEIRCAGGNNGSCEYKSGNWSAKPNAWPPAVGHQYYGRGPFQLSWNYNYG